MAKEIMRNTCIRLREHALCVCSYAGIALCLALSYSSEINDLLCPHRGFPTLPVGCHSPLWIKMAVWRTFLEFELAGSGVATRWKLHIIVRFKLKKKCDKQTLHSELAATPDQITQQNSFKKRQCGHKIQVVKIMKIRGIKSVTLGHL